MSKKLLAVVFSILLFGSSQLLALRYQDDVLVEYSNQGHVIVSVNNTETADVKSGSLFLKARHEGTTSNEISFIHQWDQLNVNPYIDRFVLGTNKANEHGILMTTKGAHDIEFMVHKAASGVPDMVLHGSGELTLGTVTPYHEQGVTANLTVNGAIAAEFVRVRETVTAPELHLKQSYWADDVFDSHYSLLPLSEVSRYIKRHFKLPGLPSEKAVVANCVNVADMQATLLRKIEELTLYIIDQNKTLQSQEKEIQVLTDHVEMMR